MHDLDRGFGQPRDDRLREQTDAGLFLLWMPRTDCSAAAFRVISGVPPASSYM
jgi:hypothetical protein